MAILKGQQVSVTATVARKQLGDPATPYTLKNLGGSTVFYRSGTAGNADMTGDAAALRTAKCCELESGDAVVIGPDVSDVDIVCATAGTATVNVLAGAITSDTTVTGTFTSSGTIKDGSAATLASVVADTSGNSLQTKDQTLATRLTAMSGDATSRTACTKNSWVAITRSRLLQLDAVTATASNTATITVWFSRDGGTTYIPALLTDTGAPAKSVAIAVGTNRIGSGNYADSISLSVPVGVTHIYVQETAQGTDNFVYSVAGV
jgi:hypothetical protein